MTSKILFIELGVSVSSINHRILKILLMALLFTAGSELELSINQPRK